jgi:DNA polymerase III epsilon subunit-like protein
MENGQIIESENYLINPECDFCERNTAKHGICKNNVAGKPTFAEFWERKSGLFDDIVAGHGLTFDLSVLAKTLSAYGIDAKPFRYIDTVKLSKQFIPGLTDFKLPTVCSALGIDLGNHHDSGNDCLAAAKILQKFLCNCPETLLAGYLTTFDADAMRNRIRRDYSQREATNLSLETRALRMLKMAIEEASKDGAIQFEDFIVLLGFMEKCFLGLYDRYPFFEIIDKVSDILEDGVVTPEELEDFTKYCHEVFNPVENSDSKFDGGVSGKHIVLTGDFALAPRKEVEKMLKERGAVMQDKPNGQTNMVIVGKLGSKAWSMGSYGSKVEKAKQLQSKGYDIKILKEEDVFPN